MNKKIRFILYFFIFLLLVGFRFQLDKEFTYITSDGQIKYYQSAGYLAKGFLNFECPYPAINVDPNFEYFPINYPWAVLFSEGKNKCVFQYPPLFSYLGSLIGLILPLQFSLYLPLLFYLLILFAIDNILTKANKENATSIFFSVFFFASSFPLLTAIDYSEISLFHLFTLIGFSYYLGFISNDKKISYLLAGMFWGLSFAIRTEIMLGLFCFFATTLLLNRNSILQDFKFYLWMGLGFCIALVLFFYLNYISSGHVLGYRFLSQLDNDKSSMGLLDHLNMAKAYLWGDQYMIGVFHYSPFLLVLFPMLFLWKKFRTLTNTFLLSSIIFFLLAASLVTVYGGVGLFGLRYMEIGFLFSLIGFNLGWQDIKPSLSKAQRWAIVFFFIFFIGYSWKNTREGLKHLRNSAGDYAKVQEVFSSIPDSGYIIHDSLYNSYLFGISFLNQKHINLYNPESCSRILKSIPRGTEVLLVQSPPDRYISADIPKRLLERYPQSFACSEAYFEKSTEILIRGMKFTKAKIRGSLE